MPKVTLHKFAELCAMPVKNLYVYIQRGLVVVTDLQRGRFIDTEHELNAAFYNKRVAKGKIKLKSGIPVEELQDVLLAKPEDKPARKRAKDTPQPYRKRTHQADEAAIAKRKAKTEDIEGDELLGGLDEDEEDDGTLMPLVKAEKTYQHYRAVRNQRAAELAEIEIARKKGELIRVDVITPFFQQHNLSIAKEVQAMLEAEARYIAKVFNLTHDQHVEMRSRFTTEINRMLERAKEGTRKAIETIIQNIEV